MKLVAMINYGPNARHPAISVVTDSKSKLINHLFKLAHENDEMDGSTYVEYRLSDRLDDPYNPALLIRSTDSYGERDFMVCAFIEPAVEL